MGSGVKKVGYREQRMLSGVKKVGVYKTVNGEKFT